MSSARTFLAAGLLVFALLLAAGYGFFVLTRVGQALDNAAYFGHGLEARELVDYDRHILSWITPIHLAAAGGVMLVIAALRRRPFTGLVAAAALFTAAFGAEWLKSHLPRTELSAPSGKVPTYFVNDTYPSGHTTAGTSMAMGLILVAGARWRRWIALGAATLSASYATAVLFLGWHRPSDAFGGILWSAICMGAGALFLLLWKRPPPVKCPGAVVLLANALLAAAGLVGALVLAGVPPAEAANDLPLAFMLALIVLPAYLTCLWLGTALAEAAET